MTLIADIVAKVAATPVPVLFLDSCILLDIVRATIRNKPGEVEFARQFLTAVLKTPKTIHLLIASPVQTERLRKNVGASLRLAQKDQGKPEACPHRTRFFLRL